jgi:hypothetical protein
LIVGLWGCGVWWWCLQVVFQKQAPVPENRPDIAAMLASASGEKVADEDAVELMRKPFQFLSVQLLRWAGVAGWGGAWL